MTSLIFGTIYMGHKGIVEHRREKQRKKNYARWEDLRDDYDAQRKIVRETRSLDIQRTGSNNYYNDSAADEQYDRPILTLRDQQEANDGRTAWRPQEVFDGPTGGSSAGRRSMDSRPSYGFGSQLTPAGTSPLTPVRSQALSPLQQTTSHLSTTQTAAPLKSTKTGAWDEGLPAPLQVSRRSYDERGTWSENPTPPMLSAQQSRSATPRDVAALKAASDDSLAANRRSVSTPATINQQQRAEQPVENRMAALLGGRTPGLEEPVEMDEWWKR